MDVIAFLLGCITTIVMYAIIAFCDEVSREELERRLNKAPPTPQTPQLKTVGHGQQPPALKPGE